MFQLQGKNSFRNKIITATVKKQSATLKTGKLPRETKSLTPHNINLSLRFQTVQANMRTKIGDEIYFFLQRYTNSPSPKALTIKIIQALSFKPREIPVLKTGYKIQSSCPIL